MSSTVVTGNQATTLGELLREREDSIVVRWLEEALATYSNKASEFFMRQQDPFANPVGHSFRTGTAGLFRALLDGSDGERLRESLHEIVKIRAVQQFPASEAIGFLFLLKGAIRAELGTTIEELRLTSELTTFEARIDKMALVAFDMFVACREQVFQLRVNEAKRRVSWVVDKMNQHDRKQESG